MRIKDLVLITSAVLFLKSASNLFAIDLPHPLNLNTTSVPEEDKNDFLFLGYRFGTTYLYAPDGHIVTQEEYRKTTEEAFDYKEWIRFFISKQKPVIPFDDEETKIRRTLNDMGWRLDPETGHVLSPSYKNLKNLEGESLFKEMFSGENGESPYPRPDSIENAAAGLEKTKSACAKSGPHSPACKAQTDALNHKLNLYAKNDPAFKKILNSGPNAHAEIMNLYQETRLYFDGDKSIVELRKTISGDYPKTTTPLPTYNDQEQTLSRHLQQKVISQLSQNPEGRVVLERLKVNGQIRLPPIFVLETSNSDAFYQWTPQGDRVVLNADAVFPQNIANRKKLISDFRAGNRYLLDHPEVFKNYLDKDDDVLAHELTHTWQERNDHLSSLSSVGLLPNRDYIDQEQEAFLTETRYLSFAALKDPQKAMEHSDFNEVIDFVHNPQRFSNGIEAEYIRGSGADAATLKDAAQIAKERSRVDQSIEDKVGPLSWITNIKNMTQWYKQKLSVDIDAKTLSNAAALNDEYSKRIISLIDDSGSLRSQTAKKMSGYDILKSNQVKNINQKLLSLSDAMNWDSTITPKMQDALKKDHLTADHAAEILRRSALKIALKTRHTALSDDQRIELYTLLMSYQKMAILGGKNSQSAFNEGLPIWNCAIKKEKCDQLK